MSLLRSAFTLGTADAKNLRSLLISLSVLTSLSATVFSETLGILTVKWKY